MRNDVFGVIPPGRGCNALAESAAVDALARLPSRSADVDASPSAARAGGSGGGGGRDETMARGVVGFDAIERARLAVTRRCSETTF